MVADAAAGTNEHLSKHILPFSLRVSELSWSGIESSLASSRMC